MRKSTFFIYSIAVWLKTFYGVTFHPYKTLWEIRRRPILSPMIASPFFTLFCIILLGKIGSVLILVYGAERMLIAIILGGAILSIFLWQILVFYFLLMFFLASKSQAT
ncbi:MAG TPA: hypothetical protein VF189_03000 [Patescibacteria group bacterium]